MPGLTDLEVILSSSKPHFLFLPSMFISSVVFLRNLIFDIMFSPWYLLLTFKGQYILNINRIWYSHLTPQALQCLPVSKTTYKLF